MDIYADLKEQYRREGIEQGRREQLAKDNATFSEYLADIERLKQENEQLRSDLATVIKPMQEELQQLRRRQQVPATAPIQQSAPAPSSVDQQQQQELRQRIAALAEREQSVAKWEAQLNVFAAEQKKVASALAIRQQALQQQQHAETVEAYVQAAQDGDFRFATASLARSIAICEQRAQEALQAAAGAYSFGAGRELRQEALQWQQQARAAVTTLANLPRPKEAPVPSSVKDFLTSPTMLALMRSIAWECKDHRAPCAVLHATLLHRVPELRTIQNGEPLTQRALGDALAGVGIKSKLGRLEQDRKPMRCYSAYSFPAPALDALPSQGSEQPGA